VPERPYVLMSVATSIDGYIDDAGSTRLVLSNEADLDRVDEVRAGCDAILVGAGTIRRDDPALLVRSARRRSARMARGLPASPAKVTLTRTGDLDPAARFFTADPAASGSEAAASKPGPAREVSKLVYVPEPVASRVRARLGGAAIVVSAGEQADLATVLSDLAARGVTRLMVEGGARVHAEFFAAGLADELHLVIAPLFVGDPAAPRFAPPEGFGNIPAGRVSLAGASQIGDVVLLRYLLSERAAG
jgi:riboflavin-specific deaminase-like protein